MNYKKIEVQKSINTIFSTDFLNNQTYLGIKL